MSIGPTKYIYASGTSGSSKWATTPKPTVAVPTSVSWATPTVSPTYSSSDLVLGQTMSFLLKNKMDFEFVGSSRIKGVEKPGDIDIVVYDEDFLTYNKPFTDSGLFKYFGYSGSPIPEPEFVSLKYYGDFDINLIWVNNKKLYNKYLSAQVICEESNLVEKSERIEVFDYIMDREGKCSMERFLELSTRRE